MPIVLSGKFELIQKIDEGGMSHVYLANNKKTGEKVAVKVLRKDLAGQQRFVKCFRQEAQTLARMRHPGIVRMVDMGLSGEVKYLAMEYIEGPTLASFIEERGRLSSAQAVRIGRSLLDALDYAHHKGIIHKDLKPSNILMDGGTRPVLTDFGIAGGLGEDPADGEQVLGTVSYFSPEQARGEQVDRRTDLYSLGVILYEMLTGRQPFEGESNVSIALKHLHQPPVPPREIEPSIPESLNKIILKALSKERKNRYSSAQEMKRDLDRALSSPDGVYVELHEQEDRKGRFEEKNSRRAIAIAAALVAVVVVLLVVFSMVSGSISPPKESDTVYMPMLTERTLEQAEEQLKELDVQLKVDYQPSMEADEGYIISQIPEAGAVLTKGEEVSVVVSTGSTGIKLMPPVVGKTVQEAQDALAQMNITEIKIEWKEDSAQAGGTVLDQFPKENSPVQVDTEVILMVAGGGDSLDINIPSLVGLNMDDAIVSARKAGFEHVFLYFAEGGQPTYQVIAQSPMPDASEITSANLALTIQQPDKLTELGGIYELTRKLEGESVVTITMGYEVSGVFHEYVAFEQAFASDDELVSQFNNRQIRYSAKMEEAYLGIKRTLSVYINGELIYTENL